MPNWCMNTLTVKGPKTSLKKFKRAVRTDMDVFSLEKLHPMPENLYNTFSPGDEPNWYDWRIENWGTKWDVGESSLYYQKSELEYFFISAWTPPVEWFKKISKQYPALKFTLDYDEPGIGFRGTAQIHDGEVKEVESS